jgi:hypothetical protein
VHQLSKSQIALSDARPSLSYTDQPEKTLGTTGRPSLRCGTSRACLARQKLAAGRGKLPRSRSSVSRRRPSLVSDVPSFRGGAQASAGMSQSSLVGRSLRRDIASLRIQNQAQRVASQTCSITLQTYRGLAEASASDFKLPPGHRRIAPRAGNLLRDVPNFRMPDQA